MTNAPININNRDKCKCDNRLVSKYPNNLYSERKRQREREENWKILQRKVSGTGAVTITTTAENDFYNFSFPSKSNYGEDDDEEDDGEEDFDIMTDEETDAELEQNATHEEQHDVIRPDMVKNNVWFDRHGITLICLYFSNNLNQAHNNSSNLEESLLYPLMKL